MIRAPLLAAVERWLETRLEVSLAEGGVDDVAVVAASEPEFKLRAVRFGERHLLVTCESWAPQLRRLCAGIEPDLLFSIFGCYELSRVAIPHGCGVWGPTWWLFADASSWRPRLDREVVRLTPEAQAQIDLDTFWHCYTLPESVAAFGIYQDDRLAALATVADRGQPFMEIGVDVAPGQQSRGLGSSVISAAGSWILEQGRLPAASVGTFNVPSARALRGVGLQYCFSDLISMPGPFRVPPQPLGKPLPDAELQDHYPTWGMNPDIQRR